MNHNHFVPASMQVIDSRDPGLMYGTCSDPSCRESVYCFFIDSDGDRWGAWSEWREVLADL